MDAWPELPYAEWKETKDTLHLWTQIVGKVALSHSPRLNHWWNCGLAVTEHGLSTNVLYEDRLPFRVEFDFTPMSCTSSPSSAAQSMHWSR